MVASARQPSVNFSSVEKELTPGKQLAQQTAARIKPLYNAAVSAYVERIARQLAAQIPSAPFSSMWPGAPVIPAMETGAPDSVYTIAAGIPSYGVSGMAIDRDDVRAHGKDERLSSYTMA